jgi:hypothetical protein
MPTSIISLSAHSVMQPHPQLQPSTVPPVLGAEAVRVKHAAFAEYVARHISNQNVLLQKARAKAKVAVEKARNAKITTEVVINAGLRRESEIEATAEALVAHLEKGKLSGKLPSSDASFLWEVY